MKAYDREEQDIMDSLVKIVNVFRSMVLTHPSHEKDFIDAIHKCQRIIMHRLLQRDYPDEFPTYIKGEKI